jgi:glutaminase
VITSVCDTPSAVAVSVAFFEAVTADAVTLKVAEVSPFDTVSEAGVRSALLLLDSITTVLLVAAALRDTEHDAVCAPVIESDPHESSFNVATGAGPVGAAGYSMIRSDFATPSAVAVRIAF